MECMTSSAVLSPDGKYRYRLDRRWGEGQTAMFVMLNPSTADATQDDPTLRRCLRFARDWGYGHLVVANLYAFRATRPADLKAASDPTGPRCDAYLEQCAKEAALIVAAWGMHAQSNRVDQVRTILGPDLRTLGWTKNGQPRHPLYVKGNTAPRLWAHGASAPPHMV